MPLDSQNKCACHFSIVSFIVMHSSVIVSGLLTGTMIFIWYLKFENVREVTMKQPSMKLISVQLKIMACNWHLVRCHHKTIRAYVYSGIVFIQSNIDTIAFWLPYYYTFQLSISQRKRLFSFMGFQIHNNLTIQCRQLEFYC